MTPKKILVTGANGQLGMALREVADQYPQYHFLFLSREDLAIHHFDLVRHFFHSFKPDFCINCAAYTAVDKAEQEKELAYIVNAEAVGVLAAVCHAQGTRFIHVSTDYVFSGNATTPYAEDAPTDPQSVYGASKREGEQQALQHHPESLIIRTSWVYYQKGKNFLLTMLRLMKERPKVSVVNDQWGSPTYAGDLAACIMEIISAKVFVPGIFHFSNEGIINWYQFALAIAEMTGSDCQVEAIPSSAYPTPVKRPAYSVLSKQKIQQHYGIQLRPWKESLQLCLNKISDANR